MVTSNLLFVKAKPSIPLIKHEEIKKCSTCCINFMDSSSQKLHFKSEWHLYNIKRKNSQLSPISQDEYISIKNQIQDMLSAKNDKNLTKKSIYNSKNTDLKYNTGSIIPKTPELCPKLIRFDPNKCLFNDFISKNINDNIKYMETHHSFFLPEKEYISDLEGLLFYLYKKIYENNLCLYCDKQFSDHYATLHHMEAKQHKKINDDQFDKIINFYDFINSYVNLIVEKQSSSSNSFDLTPSSKAIVSEDDEWEDLFSTTSTPNKVGDILNSYGIKKAYIMENGNLSLPNGKEAVHRELSYIYKQNLVVHNPLSLKNKQDNFKFKKKSEKKQIILSQRQAQYKIGKRDLNVALKSYKLFVPVRQDICFG